MTLTNRILLTLGTLALVTSAGCADPAPESTAAATDSSGTGTADSASSDTTKLEDGAVSDAGPADTGAVKTICDSGIPNCAANAFCTPTGVSTYTCTCKEGFVGNGKVCCGPGFKQAGAICSDIHECNEGLDDCHDNAACSNTTGGFTCKCKSGFAGDGKTCTAIGSDAGSGGDVDAGSLPDSGGDAVIGADTSGGTDAGTTDTGSTDTGSTDAGSTDAGSSDAGTVCPKGYKSQGGQCVDSDECVNGTAGCTGNTVCINTEGSFECACKPGFEKAGAVCSDINECVPGKNDCDAHADCANTSGGYTCKCQTGFSGDGKTCTDIDECTVAGKCPANSKCVNSAGSFACDCLPGYKKQGSACFDIDECLEKTDNCPAVCVNSPGSYVCKSTVKDVNSPYYTKSCDPEFSFHKYSWKGTAPNETYEYQTELVADCRCGGNKQAIANGGLPICQRPSDLPLPYSFGKGPTVRKLPNASMLGGYFDTAARKIYVGLEWQDSFYEDQGTILTIDADSGDRTILTGQWVSDANGYEVFGAADPTEKTYWEDEIVGVGNYKNPLGRTYHIEKGADGYLYAMTTDKDLYTVIVRVDIATGNRKVMWAEHRTLDPQGKNNPAHIQCSNGAKGTGTKTVELNQEAGFALDPTTGDYLLPVLPQGTTVDTTPNGIIRIKKDGTACEWVTRFGMGSNNEFTGQTIGTGPLAQFTFDAMYIHEGKLLAVELDTNQDVFQIDLTSGKRTVLGEGVSTDWLSWDSKRNLMWGGGTGAGTAVMSWNMTSGITFSHIGELLAKPADFQRVTGPLGVCCGTHKPGWFDPLNGQIILMHNVYSLVRLEPESGNSVILSL